MGTGVGTARVVDKAGDWSRDWDQYMWQVRSLILLIGLELGLALAWLALALVSFNAVVFFIIVQKVVGCERTEYFVRVSKFLLI